MFGLDSLFTVSCVQCLGVWVSLFGGLRTCNRGLVALVRWQFAIVPSENYWGQLGMPGHGIFHVVTYSSRIFSILMTP